MFAMIFIFGYAIRICESPLIRNDDSENNLSLYSNAMWNIMITMTTVGYGDFYVRTDLGRYQMIKLKKNGYIYSLYIWCFCCFYDGCYINKLIDDNIS